MAHNAKPAKQADEDELIKTPEARQLYDKAIAQIKKGALGTAAKSLHEAAVKEPNNKFLRHQYLNLRVAIRLQKAIALEKNAKRWWKSALALYRFYTQHELNDQLLELTTIMHERRNTPQTAILLASAQLRLDKNTDAARTLQAVPAEKRLVRGQMLLGIALSREKETIDQGKAILADIDVKSLDTPADLYYLARLQALTDHAAVAIATLTRAFEKTKPSAINEFKDMIRNSKDFASIRKSEAFAKSMDTQSKTPESDCSGGSTCGSCAQRSSCSAAPKTSKPTQVQETSP